MLHLDRIRIVLSLFLAFSSVLNNERAYAKACLTHRVRDALASLPAYNEYFSKLRLNDSRGDKIMICIGKKIQSTRANDVVRV